jgi:hypothetical protein
MTDAENEFSRALIAYRDAYEASIETLGNDEAEMARRLIAKARYVVRVGGISGSLLLLLKETQYWQSSGDASGNSRHRRLNAEDIEISTHKKSDTACETLVSFVYKGESYRLSFVDLGWSSLADEKFHHGRVEFHTQGELVLGLDIADDKDPHDPHWTDFGLYAFRVGDWIQPLIEMSVDIEASKNKESQMHESADLVRRASNVKLSDEERSQVE